MMMMNMNSKSRGTSRDSSHLKLLLASLLLVISMSAGYALAWCDNPETGQSASVFVSIYTVSACNPNEKFPEGTEVIEFWRKNTSGESEGESQTIRLSDECKRTRNGGLSCAKNGKSPLAGTTYIVTKDMQDVCDETGKALVNRWTCVKGCGKDRAPKHIEGSPWEC